MLSSFFSTSPPVDPKAPNFHPVSAGKSASDLFGELEPKDTEWTCPGGFAAETQVWYHLLDDGSHLMCQVIHSSLGVWYPTIQFTCKLYNPKTKERVWKSLNVSNFVTPPPGLDKRSSKSDQFSIVHKDHPGDEFAESYAIRVNLADDLQISLDVKRPASAPGWKVGKGPKGGHSYFGHDVEKPDGYVVHRFWPSTSCTGVVIRSGHAESVKGTGMFVHAIQGMRPNLVAARWNFAHFISEAHGGTSAIQMEFTTTDAYGRHGASSGSVAVNVGSLVVGGKLVAVTAETKYPDEPLPETAEVMSRAIHSKTALDSDTGYNAPTELTFRWAAPSILPDTPGNFDATVVVDVGQPDAYNGLVDKVDFLAEVPAVIKTMIAYAAGTKPYIYQWLNPAKMSLTIPSGVIPEASGTVEVDGVLYNEATFISV
ncbi:oxidative stress survival Svf1-like protein [Fomitopsis betulina]|nr:oxidative stress survival Svf1-like protein [Fomitopsis betulina]